MNIKYRWHITIGLFALAGICYLIGSVVGLRMFLVLGLVFEMGFWLRLFKMNRYK